MLSSYIITSRDKIHIQNLILNSKSPFLKKKNIRKIKTTTFNTRQQIFQPSEMCNVANSQDDADKISKQVNA